ncbi:MAG: acyl-CoA dehydrogenase family protein, partial [Actinomycetota bacterium]
MSHYRSNLQDLEFNLFEVHRIQDRLEAWPELDEATIRDILRELERFAREEWARSFVEADRVPLELVNGEVRLPESLKGSLQAARDAGWTRLGLPEELGGVEIPPPVLWATEELLLGANPTATFYGGGGMFARLIHAEGTSRQKELARLMVEREWAGTMVLTEPDAGSDVGAGTTRAVHVEDDTYHLEGVKRFITSGEHDASDNIIHLVLA